MPSCGSAQADPDRLADEYVRYLGVPLRERQDGGAPGHLQFGYLLLWVILCSNLMAMLIQSMSAKLGIATGKNLPEACRERFARPLTLILWLQAELIAMATDLAEFIGAALALNLLFGIPLLPAGLLTGVGSFGILALRRRGFRPIEAVISSLIGVIILGFAFQMFYAEPSAERILSGLFTPKFAGAESVLLASGILGARRRSLPGPMQPLRAGPPSRGVRPPSREPGASRTFPFRRTVLRRRGGARSRLAAPVA